MALSVTNPCVVETFIWQQSTSSCGRTGASFRCNVTQDFGEYGLRQKLAPEIVLKYLSITDAALSDRNLHFI